MAGYREVLTTRHVSPLLFSQLFARFPQGMISLALLMHIEQRSGSYGLAGAVVGAYSIGAALAGPLTGRWMMVWGIRPVLAITVVCSTAALAVVALVHMPVTAYLALGLVLGAAAPPIQSAVRTIYPKVVNASKLTTLFSLDASAQELIWVLGPVAVTFVSAQFGTAVALVVSAVCTLIGGAWFASLSAVGKVRIPRSKRRFGSVLRRRVVLFGTMIGATMIGTWGAVEAATVAGLGGNGFAAGIVLAICSVGSLTGGLAVGNRPMRPWSLAVRTSVTTVGILAAAAFMNPYWLGSWQFVAGLGSAPALAVLYAMVSSGVRFSDTAEAYGWVGTGQLIGSAVGSALAGFAIDHSGAPSAFLVAGAFAAVTTLLALIARPWLPDFGLRRPGPLPETSPVPVVKE